jgi:glycosyltransferase involved in cell wall biosynthesis
MNAAIEKLVAGLTPEVLERLVDKHGVLPYFPEPWRKNLFGGSDDHSSLNLARTFTEVQSAETFHELWNGVEEGHARVRTRPATPQAFARNVYGIAYQFYKSKLAFEHLTNKDIFLRFLDQSLHTRPGTEESLLSRFHMLLARRRRRRLPSVENHSLVGIASFEAEQLIRNDPQLMEIVRTGNSHPGDMDEKWCEFVNQVSSKLLVHFGGRIVDRVLSTRLLELFKSIGAVTAMYAILAPYFVSYSLHAAQRKFSRQVLDHFGASSEQASARRLGKRLAHFTDVFHSGGGVSRMLQQQLDAALASGVDYNIVTCNSEPAPLERGVRRFAPVGSLTLPDYGNVRLLYPPFLQMLRDCYTEGYTHVHIATPGPVGLAGLAIARILKLPVSGTYHPSITHQAKSYTEDEYVAEIVSKCLLWFYDQLDAIYVPSNGVREELVGKGLNPEKIRIGVHGVDLARFHPRHRNGFLEERFPGASRAVSALYVGRLSREKGLHRLCEAYRAILAEGIDLRLVFAGDGPEGKELGRLFEGTPAVFLQDAGPDELPPLYASCDYYVHPGDIDPFNNAVLEAQASGLPVVISERAAQDNLRPGETGLVVPGDDMEALREAMAALTTDAGLREQMGRAARAYAESRGQREAFSRLYAMYVNEHAAPVKDDLAAMMERLTPSDVLAS